MNNADDLKKLNMKAVEHYAKMAKVCFEIFAHCQPTRAEYVAFMNGVLAEMKTSILWKHCTSLESMGIKLLDINQETNQHRLCDEIARYIEFENTIDNNQEYFKNEQIETTIDFPNAGVAYNIKIELTACERK